MLAHGWTPQHQTDRTAWDHISPPLSSKQESTALTKSQLPEEMLRVIGTDMERGSHLKPLSWLAHVCLLLLQQWKSSWEHMGYGKSRRWWSLSIMSERPGKWLTATPAAPFSTKGNKSTALTTQKLALMMHCFPCNAPIQQALGTLVFCLLNPPNSVSLYRLPNQVHPSLENSDITLWIVVPTEGRSLYCHGTPPLLCPVSSMMG